MLIHAPALVGALDTLFCLPGGGEQRKTLFCIDDSFIDSITNLLIGPDPRVLSLFLTLFRGWP